MNDTSQIESRLWNRARTVLRWVATSVADLRAMTDEEILDLRTVGPRLASIIFEIRDTWHEERVSGFLDIPVTIGEMPRSLGERRARIVEAGACNWVGEGVPMMAGG